MTIFARQLHSTAAAFTETPPAVFTTRLSPLTHELIRRNARPAFRDNRVTPGHNELPRLIRVYFTHMSAGRQNNLTALVAALYLDRLAADHSLIRVDRQSCRDSYLAAKKIFNYLGCWYK